MVFTGLDIQVFISVAVILGCAFIALLCDYYKGINERLREQALELAVRLEAQSRAAAMHAPAPPPPADLTVILAAISRVGETIEGALRQSMREEREMERTSRPLAPPVEIPHPEVVAQTVEAALVAAIEPEIQKAVPTPAYEPVELAAPVVEEHLTALIEDSPAEVKIPAPELTWSERPVEPPQIELLPLELPDLETPEPKAEPEPEPVLMETPVVTNAAPNVFKIKVLRNQNPEPVPTLIEPTFESALPPPPPPPPLPPPPPPPVLAETPFLELPDETPVILNEVAPEIPAMPELPVTEQIAALAQATAPEVLVLPKGFVDRATFDALAAQPLPFTGLVVSIGINEYETMSQAQGQAAVDKLVADVEKLAGSLISSLTGVEHFACRSANDEFVLAFANESGPAAQRRLSSLSERLWDFQLRSLGNYSVVFSWGATEAYGEPFAEAIASASERMRETRMNRRSPSSSTTARPRLKKVVNA